jgi:hypothetical protein
VKRIALILSALAFAGGNSACGGGHDAAYQAGWNYAQSHDSGMTDGNRMDYDIWSGGSYDALSENDWCGAEEPPSLMGNASNDWISGCQDALASVGGS